MQANRGSARYLAAVAAFIVVLCLSFGAAYAHKHVFARSGEPTVVKSAKQRGDKPVTFRVVSPPQHGTVRTQYQVRAVGRASQGASARVTEVVYQSKKGFVGEDSFKLLRVSGDPSDPYKNEEVTIAVTVQ